MTMTKTTSFTALKDEGGYKNVFEKHPLTLKIYPYLREVGTHQVPLVGEEGICRLLLGLRQLHQVFYLKVNIFSIFLKYFSWFILKYIIPYLQHT